MSRPGDGARDNWQVTHNRRGLTLPLILILNFANQTRVLREENLVLAVKAILQVIAVKDATELAEKA